MSALKTKEVNLYSNIDYILKRKKIFKSNLFIIIFYYKIEPFAPRQFWILVAVYLFLGYTDTKWDVQDSGRKNRRKFGKNRITLPTPRLPSNCPSIIYVVILRKVLYAVLFKELPLIDSHQMSTSTLAKWTFDIDITGYLCFVLQACSSYCTLTHTHTHTLICAICTYVNHTVA